MAALKYGSTWGFLLLLSGCIKGWLVPNKKEKECSLDGQLEIKLRESSNKISPTHRNDRSRFFQGRKLQVVSVGLKNAISGVELS